MLMPLKQWSAAAATLIFAVAVCVPLVAEACGPGRAGNRRRSPRKLTPLVYKQHVPNIPEHSIAASGALEKRLTRDDPKFKELVPNYNPDILFKDDEGSGQDRLMTQRLKEKLNTLAISTMNQWPGVRLRVTESWDDEGLHAEHSLHYGGRAIDITTSDRDRSKYGMLARLAIEAGFDWVYYESRSHIHCSVKSESADATRTGGCFHGANTVQTPEGRLKMSELRVGDRVLVVDAESGSLRYSKVMLFMDRNESQSHLYLTIETESGKNITMTPSHLIYISGSERTEIADGFVTFARNVEPGHYVYTSVTDTDSKSKLSLDRTIAEKVVRVTFSERVGVYAPLTIEGSIVVNDVVASCYAVINEQEYAHLAFLPIRIADNFKEAMSYFLGKFSYQTKRSSIIEEGSSVKPGIHWYPKLVYQTFHNLLPSRLLY